MHREFCVQHDHCEGVEIHYLLHCDLPLQTPEIGHLRLESCLGLVIPLLHLQVCCCCVFWAWGNSFCHPLFFCALPPYVHHTLHFPPHKTKENKMQREAFPCAHARRQNVPVTRSCLGRDLVQEHSSLKCNLYP